MAAVTLPLLTSLLFLIYSPLTGTFLKVPRVKVGKDECPNTLFPNQETISPVRLHGRCSTRSFFFDPHHSAEDFASEQPGSFTVQLHTYAFPSQPVGTWSNGNASRLSLRVPVKVGNQASLENCSSDDSVLPQLQGTSIVMDSSDLPRHHVRIFDATRKLVLLAQRNGEVKFVPKQILGLPLFETATMFEIIPATKQTRASQACHRKLEV